MRKYRAAIIGLGKQSTEDHLPGIINSQFAELVAVCDINTNLVSRVASQYKVKGYDSCQELLKKERIDFAIVAVPHDAYADIIPTLVKHKVHILKEKPFARNLREAIKFAKLIKNADLECMVTLQRRFNPIFNSFLQLKDQIGDLYFVDCRVTMFLEEPQSGWRGLSKTAGGGVILDLGYHMIDLIIWYFGLPDYIHAQFNVNNKNKKCHNVEDMAALLFCYKSGFHGSLFISSHCPPKEQNIKLLGSRGLIQLERGSISRMSCCGEVMEKLTRENAWPAASTEQIDYFCRILNRERENYGGPEYHMKHMAFIEAAYRSQKQGSYISPKDLLNRYEY
ncbi:MAG: Gfo/Idh/MocA family oxidoreductase [bacterium]|nr:Gfo/Idh/MocA family oxidoreductase [bacterium]